MSEFNVVDLKLYISDYKGALHEDFKVEHEMTMFHRLWGSGKVESIVVRERGGWYLNVKFSNHHKIIISDTLSGYFVRKISVKTEYFHVYNDHSAKHESDLFNNLNEPNLASEESQNIKSDKKCTVAYFHE